MTTNLKIMIFTPKSSVGIIVPPGSIQTEYGDSVLQVLDLTTGADVTNSFDPFINLPTGITQLDTIPSPSHTHLLVVQKVGTPKVSIGFCVGTSLGSAAGTYGSVSAPGICKGDIVLQAFYPTTAFNGNGYDYRDKFAPTCSVDDTITQFDGVPNSHPILFLYQKMGLENQNYSIFINWGSGGTIGGGNPVIKAGALIVAALNLITEEDNLPYMYPYAPANGLMIQLGGPSNNDQILFLLKNPQ